MSEFESQILRAAIEIVSKLVDLFLARFLRDNKEETSEQQ